MSKQQIEQLQKSIDNYRQGLEALQRLMDSLLKEEAEKHPKKLEIWKPEANKDYYFILSEGTIEDTSYNTWPLDIRLHYTGNCFPTKELAEYYAKRRAARQRLEMLALAENGMVPYEHGDTSGYCLIADKDDGVAIDTHAEFYHYGTQYFPTRQAAQRVLLAMTDDDLITLFGTANRGAK